MPSPARAATENAVGITVWRPPVARDIVFYRGTHVSHAYPRHWHDELHLCAYTTGSGYLACRGSSCLVGPGDFVITPPGEVHENWVPRGYGISYRSAYIPVYMLRAAICQFTDKEQDLPDFPDMFPRKKLLTNKFLRTYQAMELGGPQLRGEELLLDFLSLLLRSHSSLHTHPRRLGQEKAAVCRVREYIDEHFAESISLAQLSAIAGLSQFHIHRLFRSQIGMPPHAYQTQLRINRTKDLLRQRRPLCEIAASTGFADQSHLTRHFRRIVGIPPGRFSHDSSQTA